MIQSDNGPFRWTMLWSNALSANDRGGGCKIGALDGPSRRVPPLKAGVGSESGLSRGAARIFFREAL